MKKKIVLALIVCFVLCIGSVGYTAQKRLKRSYRERQKVLKNLAARYKNWYHTIYHISADEEKQVFLSLTNNRDRDIFIRAFWLQRDPTPGTEENEYKIEIEQRFAHVQKIFSRSSSKPGWMTDKGKYYMILGKPSSVEQFNSKPGLYPAEVWYYYGDQSLGLPTYFNITFFRPHNTTEWKFYNPSVDGPAALLVQEAPVDETNYSAIHERIREAAPELAMPAMTMIPNEIAPGFRPPMRNNLIVSNIHESPRRKINVSYATHFLNYKGYVELESSINYIGNTKQISVTRYGRYGFNFVNISLKPKKISVGYNEKRDKYYFNYELNVSLKKGEKFVYEYKKNFDFYIEPDEVNQLKGNGIVIHDTFPVIPGEYDLTVFAMNSVGKEFTYFDKKINVMAEGAQPVLATPLLGYKVDEQPDDYFFPYKFNGQKLYVDTQGNLELNSKPRILLGAYNLDNHMWQNGSFEIAIKSMEARNSFVKTYSVPLKNYSYRKNLNVLYEPPDPLNAGYYEYEVRLKDKTGKILDLKQSNFGVSPLRTIGYPQETFKKLRADNPFLFYYTLATQYEKIGQTNEAEKYYARCVENKPDFKQGYVNYLNVLNKQKKFTQVVVDAEKLKGEQELEFDYHRLKATALYGMKDYKEALNHLIKANTIYDSDVRILNLMGFTLLNLKDYPEALKALEASMKVNGKQAFIAKTIKKVKGRMNAGK
jgi:GWxTD domain-containing protein